jgi:hypothetical protein
MTCPMVLPPVNQEESAGSHRRPRGCSDPQFGTWRSGPSAGFGQRPGTHPEADLRLGRPSPQRGVADRSLEKTSTGPDQAPRSEDAGRQ